MSNRMSIGSTKQRRPLLLEAQPSNQGQQIVEEKGMMVCVRVRPLSQKEIDIGIKSCCQVINNSIVAIRKEGSGGYLKSEQPVTNDYAFDVAFDEHATQHEVYLNTAKKYIPNLLAGLNVTVFCYGATGAGKTHTMLGSTRSDEAAANAEAGIIPNAICDLFQQIHEKRNSLTYNNGEDWVIILSFIEVYNEQVYDLLESSGKVLSLREDSEKGVVHVAGVTEQKVENYDNVLELLTVGNKNRKTEATMANSVSSRSHAVLQLTVKHIRRLECGRESVVESKLSLIDLAGSERASATNNRGARLQEGANINKSLLALANCINALSSNSTSSSQKQGNVKYRDSKLTHLLKSSLEGNCNLVMIANVNPSHLTYEDSHNTLKYANRAKNLKVNPLIKDSVKENNWMEREARLREENEALRNRVQELERILSEMNGGIALTLHQGKSSNQLFQAPDQSQSKLQSTKFGASKPSRRDTLVLDKENQPNRGHQSPVRRVIVTDDFEASDSFNDHECDAPEVIVDEAEFPRKKRFDNFFEGTEGSHANKRTDRDDDDDNHGNGNCNNHGSYSHHQNGGANQASSTSSRSLGSRINSAATGSNKSSQGAKKRAIYIADELENQLQDVEEENLDVRAEENKRSIAPDECSVSLATVDCMFDVLSDSILAAGLFSSEMELPTPIKGLNTESDEHCFEQTVQPNTKCVSLLNSKITKDNSKSVAADKSEEQGSRKRRSSCIPSVSTRKFTVEDDSKAKYPADEAQARRYSTRSSKAPTLSRKTIQILDESELIASRETELNSQVQLASSDGYKQPSSEISTDKSDSEEPALKKPMLTGRRKSLASISSMLNVLSSTDFGDVKKMCKPVVDDGNTEIENKMQKMTLRRKSLMESVTGSKSVREREIKL